MPDRSNRRVGVLLGVHAPRATPLLEGLLRVRARLIRAILLFTPLLGLGVLAVGIWPPLWSPLFPYEGIGLILLSVPCLGLLRIERWGVPSAAAIYISGISQPFIYASQAVTEALRHDLVRL